MQTLWPTSLCLVCDAERMSHDIQSGTPLSPPPPPLRPCAHLLYSNSSRCSKGQTARDSVQALKAHVKCCASIAYIRTSLMWITMSLKQNSASNQILFSNLPPCTPCPSLTPLLCVTCWTCKCHIFQALLMWHDASHFPFDRQAACSRRSSFHSEDWTSAADTIHPVNLRV